MAAEDSAGRKSWDETAVLVAVKGYEPFYSLVNGKIIIEKDGTNKWNYKGTGNAYLKEKTSWQLVNEYIDNLIQHQPFDK